jgi:hypothetical protein
VVRLDDGNGFAAFWLVELIEHNWNLQLVLF